MTYQEFFDKEIAQLTSLHSSGTEKMTPFSLCEETVARAIDFTDWSQKVLDPSCGKGSFLLATIKGFLTAGCPADHLVNNIIHGYDIDPGQLRATRIAIKRVTGLSCPNIQRKDFINEEIDMTPDVITGNPPYQKGNQSLWHLFALKAETLVKDNGYIAFITPNSWANGSHLNTSRNVFNSLFQKLNTTYINTNVNSYFPKIGKNIGAWVVQKSSYKGITTVIDKDGNILETNINDVPFFLNNFSVIGFSIFKKVLAKKEFFTEFTEKVNDKERCFAFPKAKHISYTSYGYKYDGIESNFPTSRVTVGIDCSDRTIDEVKSIESLFQSKLYKFLWIAYGATDAGSFGWILRSMPKLPLSKIYTNDEIYKHFNLTQDEINYIEENV